MANTSTDKSQKKDYNYDIHELESKKMYLESCKENLNSSANISIDEK